MSPLTQEQIDQYNQDGFLLVKAFIAPETIEQIREQTRRLPAQLAGRDDVEGIDITWENLPDGEPPLIRQLMGSQNVSPEIRTIAQSEQMLGAMEQLLGAEVELFHSKLMMKAARNRSPRRPDKAMLPTVGPVSRSGLVFCFRRPHKVAPQFMLRMSSCFFTQRHRGHRARLVAFFSDRINGIGAVPCQSASGQAREMTKGSLSPARTEPKPLYATTH